VVWAQRVWFFVRFANTLLLLFLGDLNSNPTHHNIFIFATSTYSHCFIILTNIVSLVGSNKSFATVFANTLLLLLLLLGFVV
jgi:hypothetical protein